MHKGPVAGYEVMGVHMRLEDGSYHDVDSSTMAFEICARDCFRETFKKAEPVLLEPIMKVEVEIPTEFQGPVTGAISSKRGVILGTESRSGYTVITAEVPLAEMFGYSNDLRSIDAGQGELQHGVPQVSEGALAIPGRDRQEGSDAGQGRRQGLSFPFDAEFGRPESGPWRVRTMAKNQRGKRRVFEAPSPFFVRVFLRGISATCAHSWGFSIQHSRFSMELAPRSGIPLRSISANGRVSSRLRAPPGPTSR